MIDIKSFISFLKTKKAKKTLLIIGSVFTVFLVCFFVFRNTILNSVVTRLKAKAKTEYNSDLHIKNIEFQGFKEIQIKDICLVPKQADTLFNFKEIRIGFSLWNALLGRVQINELNIHDGYAQLLKNEKGSNYTHLFKNKTKANPKNTPTKNYAKQGYRIISKILRLVPTQMTLNNITFRYQNFNNQFSFKIDALQLDDDELDSDILMTTKTYSQRWKISGIVDPRDETADLAIYSPTKSVIRVPYLEDKFNLKLGFNKLQLRIDAIDKSGDELIIKGATTVTNLKINHPKIAANEVNIPSAGITYQFNLGATYLELDQQSEVQFNKVKLNPYIAYHTDKDTTYSLKINMPTIKTQDFIESLPTSLFSHFQGMKATGEVAYRLNFKFNKNKPDDVILDSKVTASNVKITDFGSSELDKMNSGFVYRAIDNGVLQRPIYVSDSNPSYTRLDQMSPYIEKCVLTSEDPSFYHHNGFVNEAFRQSIAKNIKTKKFARGASTISMQLVKNIFLTRDKNLSRKLEEILLVYALESTRVTSKRRMFEVYFNIIEWGPNIFGIGEAAAFYFQKRPSDLTLKESLFLASIIPRPKKYRWQFDNSGQLKEFAKTKHNFIKNLMLRRGLISANDTIGYHYPLHLKGHSAHFVIEKEDDFPDQEVDFSEFE